MYLNMDRLELHETIWKKNKRAILMNLDRQPLPTRSWYWYYEFVGLRDDTFSNTIMWMNCSMRAKVKHRVYMLVVLALSEV